MLIWQLVDFFLTFTRDMELKVEISYESNVSKRCLNDRKDDVDLFHYQITFHYKTLDYL